MRNRVRHHTHASARWLCATLLVVLPCTFAQAGTPVARHSTENARLHAEAQNVTITRDTWGIPHVHGKTDADAVFGIMYVKCKDDFKRVQTNLTWALGLTAHAKGKQAIWSNLRARPVPVQERPDSRARLQDRVATGKKRQGGGRRWLFALGVHGIRRLIPRAITHADELFRMLVPRWAYLSTSGAGAAVSGGRFNRVAIDIVARHEASGLKVWALNSDRVVVGGKQSLTMRRQVRVHDIQKSGTGEHIEKFVGVDRTAALLNPTTLQRASSTITVHDGWRLWVACFGLDQQFARSPAAACKIRHLSCPTRQYGAYSK